MSFADVNLKPHFQVQAKLSEDWFQPSKSSPNFKKFTSHRIVITTSYLDKENNAFSPYKDQIVEIQSREADLPVILQANGRLEKSKFIKGRTYSFKTNAVGRVAFSVPIVDGPVSDSQKENLVNSIQLPPLMLRTSFMKNNEWVVAHPDYAAFHTLGGIKSSTLRQLNPTLKESDADSAAKVIQNLMTQAMKSSPLMESNQKSGKRLIKRRLLRRNHHYNQMQWHNQEKPYVPHKDLIATYHVPFNAEQSRFERILPRQSASSPSSSLSGSPSWSFLIDTSKENNKIIYHAHSHSTSLSKRSPSRLTPRGLRDWWDKVQNRTENAISSFAELLATPIRKCEIAFQDRGDGNGNGLVMFIQDVAGSIKRFVVETVQQVIQAVVKVFNWIKVSVTKVLEKIRWFFSWDSVLRYTQFLRHYCKSIIPLAPQLHDVKSDLLESAIANMSTSVHNSFNSVANYFGGNISLNALPSLLQMKAKGPKNFTKPGATSDLRESVKGVEHSVVEDMFVNNAAEGKIEVKNGTAKDIDNLAIQFLKDLKSEGVFDDAGFKEANTKLVTFQKENTNLLARSVTYFFALLDVMFQLTAKVITKVLRGVLKIIPLMNKYMWEITNVKLYIPLLYQFYNDVISRDTHDFNLFNIYILMASMHNVYTIKLFQNVEPITEAELKVYLSEPNPMFYKIAMRQATHLGPWNAEREHRVNTQLDWGPRGMLMFLVDLAIAQGYLQVFVNLSPVATFFRRFSTAAVAWVMIFTIFPVEQVPDKSPATIHQALYNVNNPWFLWYSAWTVSMVIKQIQTIDAAIPLPIPTTVFRNMIGIFLGIPQGVAQILLLKDILPATNWKDPKRATIAILNTGSWIFDTLSYYSSFLPAPFSKVVGITVDSLMVGFYTGRFVSMVAFNKAGLMEPTPLWNYNTTKAEPNRPPPLITRLQDNA